MQEGIGGGGFAAMLLKLIILLLLFPSTLMAQNYKPLIATDNSTQTCNTTRMIFSPGDLSCSGSVATVTTGGGSSQWTTSGSDIYNSNAGNVGIGTNAPTEKLDIMGAVALNGGLALWADSIHVNVGVGNSNFRNTNIPNSMTGDGIQNTYFGDNSIDSNINGFLNAGFGDNTLGLNTDGYANSAFGSGSLASNTLGYDNVGFGPFSLIANTTGNDNIGVGFYAGGNNDTGSGNLILGSNAGGSIITGSNNIIFGSSVDTPLADDASNTLNIGNAIYGTGLGGSPNIGIGTATPQTKLAVIGNVGIGTWTAAGGALIVKGGNVGIGTTTANVALDVIGQVRPSTGILFGDGSSQTTAATTTQWTTSGSDINYTAGDVGIGTTKTTTSALTVMNGNVGVGTWIPSALLNVSGSSPTVKLNNSNASGQGTFNITDTGSGGAILFKANGSSTANTNISNIPLSSVFTTTAPMTGGMVFYTQTAAPILFGINGSSGEKARIDSAGNFGIGTSSPMGKLVVNGGVGIGTANSSFVTTAPPSGGMIVENNVGIGTVNANQKLTVAGTIYSTSGGVQFPDNTTQTTAVIGGGISGLTTGTIPKAASATSLNDSILTQSGNSLFIAGNVGIGTQAPFNSSTPPAGGFYTQGNVGIGTTTTSRLVTISKNFDAATPGSTTLYVNGYGTNAGALPSRAYVDYNGSDGTASSDIIVANVQGGNNFDLVCGGTTSTGYVRNGSHCAMDVGGSGNTSFEVGTITNIPMAIMTNATERMTILGGGNVGIGTVTPGQALDVQGNIRVSAIGSTLSIATGSNACQGQATLSGGTITVSTTCTPSNSQGIHLTDATSSLTNVGTPTVGTVTGGTSFVINSTNPLDSSNVNWIIFKSQ